MTDFREEAYILEKMEITDDDNEDNDCEQSDIVSLVLNMAFIPERLSKIL